MIYKNILNLIILEEVEQMALYKGIYHIFLIDQKEILKIIMKWHLRHQ